MTARRVVGPDGRPWKVRRRWFTGVRRPPDLWVGPLERMVNFVFREMGGAGAVLVLPIVAVGCAMALLPLVAWVVASLLTVALDLLLAPWRSWSIEASTVDDRHSWTARGFGASRKKLAEVGQGIARGELESVRLPPPPPVDSGR